MITEFYTEIYLDDAMHLCMYIAGKHAGSSISIVPANNIGCYPDAPKGLEFPDGMMAVRVSSGEDVIAECCYLQQKLDSEEAKKFRSRWLISVMIGDVIRRAREEAGLSLEELARKTGYRAHSLDSMERGRYAMDVKQLGRIADALGCEIRLVKKN